MKRPFAFVSKAADRTSDANLVTLICLVVFGVSIAATIRHREWNSDDVGMQQLLTTFRPFQEEIGHVTDDTFVLKFPLYALVHAAIGASVRALTATIWIIQATSVGLLIWAVRRVDNQSSSWKSLMPLCWFCSLGLTFFTHQIGPNGRNFEMSAALVLSVLATQSRSRTQQLFIGIAAGLLLLDDPFYAYTMVMPLLLLVGMLAILPKTRRELRGSAAPLANAATVGGVAIIVWQLGRLALYAAGIRIHGRTIRIASLDEIHPGLVNSWAATRLFFGFTSEVQPVRRILSFLVFALMLAIPLFAVTRKRSIRLLWLALPAATLGAFVTSREALDLGAGRYLLFMVMSLTFAATVLWSFLPNSIANAAVAVFALSTIANVGSSVAALQRPGVTQPHQALADLLVERQATKGYAGFWDANITAYLSDGKTIVASVACDAGATKHYYYNADDAVRSQPAQTSFVIIDDANAAGACNRSEIIAQFGAPSSEEKVNKWSILFYPRDIREDIAVEGITGYGKAWTPAKIPPKN